MRPIGLVILLVLSCAVPTYAATYYVSAAGSDSNDGMSAGAPWLTLDKVNDTAFTSDDKVYFRCGDTFNGGIFPLVRSTRGTSGHPVTYSRYGTCDGTNDPIIDGDSSARTWMATGTPHVYEMRVGVGTMLKTGTSSWNVFVDGVPLTRTTRSDNPATYAAGTWGPYPGPQIGMTTDHIYLRLPDDTVPNTTHSVTVMHRTFFSGAGLGDPTPVYLTLDHLHFRGGSVGIFNTHGITVQHVQIDKTIGIAMYLGGVADSTIDDVAISNFSTNGLYVNGPEVNGVPNNLTVSRLHISCGGIGRGGRDCGLGPGLDPYGFVASTDEMGGDTTCSGWQSTSGVSVTDSDFDYCGAGLDVTWTTNFTIQRNRFNCSKGRPGDCGGVSFHGTSGDISNNHFDGEGRGTPGLSVRWVNMNANFGGPLCPAPCASAKNVVHDNVMVRVTSTAIVLSAAEPGMIDAFDNLEQFLYPATATVNLFSVNTDGKPFASKPILLHDNTFVVPKGVALSTLRYNWVDGPHSDGIAGFEALSGSYGSTARNGP